jgi:type IV secretory pathway TraG/TraD family ATPase VirD4
MAGQQSWAEKRWWRGTVYDWLGAVLGGVLVVFVLHIVTLSQLTLAPLQRYYVNTYRASCTVARRPPVLPYLLQPNGSRRLASLGDVVVLPSTPNSGLRLSLSTKAIRAGVKGVQFLRVSERGMDLACADLANQIQMNGTGSRTGLSWFVLAPLAMFAIGFALSYVRYRRTSRTMRRGHALRGPELVTASQFKRLKRGDGVGFSTREAPTFLSLLVGPARRRTLSVRRQEESSHFLLMGDTGTGKSSLIRQLLEQVADRNEAAVVYDPALEFTPQFYRPERGDRILNPLDTRMPYWSPGKEIQHKVEALAFAKALFPDDRRDNRFFVESPRKVFARLLSFKPTAKEIAHWLQNPSEIDRLVAGTELASMIDPSAPSQRAGVLASLSMVGDAFQLIPQETETAGSWSAYEWAQHRKGWLFLTSTPQTLDRLRPLISAWFDLLLMRLLAGGEPVWMVLDELPTLNKLPKLPEALALARKPNVRLVIGLQGRAQLESRYGTEAEAMLSQPATRIFLRTSEPRAAEWISEAVGEVEFERLRESVNYEKLLPLVYARKSHNYSLDRQTRPLVLASEITGLSNLTGYLKSENYVVRFQFDPNPVQRRQSALLTRPVGANEWPQRPSPDQPSSPAPKPGHRHSRRLESSRAVEAPARAGAAVEREPYFD